MYRSFLLTLALLTLTARPASAQFRIDPLPKKKIQGLSAKETDSFYASVEALSKHLASLPEVNTPVAPVCIALQREVFAYPLTPNQAQGKIYIGYMAAIGKQTCREAKTVNSSVQFNLNVAPFANQNQAIVEDEQGWIFAPREYSAIGDGVFKLQLDKSHFYVITRGREPALVPVSVERYLKTEERKAAQRMEEVQAAEAKHKEWVQGMRASYGADLGKAPADLRDTFKTSMREAEETNRKSRAEAEGALQAVRGKLTGLSAAQRAQPACLEFLKGGSETNVVGGPCKEPQLALYSLNPALTKSNGEKGAVRYLVVEALDIRHSTEAEYNHKHRTALMEHFDFGALARVVRSGK